MVSEPGGLFIAGTDTGVGKTRIAAACIAKLAAQGRKVVGMKPVASGCPEHDNELCDDVRQLVEVANVTAPLEWINPYRFMPPVAPHLAAQQAGRLVSLTHIGECYGRLRGQAQVVVVEGVGGLLVPLNGTEDTADLARQLDVPVLLVVGLRLGCINHALLTVAAIQQRGLRLYGWIANALEPAMLLQNEVVATLEQRIAAPLLAVLPYAPHASASELAGQIRLP